jgi:hypothetical protein
MLNPENEPHDGDPVIEATVIAALEDLLGADAPGAAGGTPNVHWLGLGLRLGLERPDRARRLLEMLAAEVAPAAGDTATAPAQDQTDDVPIRSRLLARSASLPPAAKGATDSEAVFGWISRLAPSEILAMGRVVEQMLADGAPSDVTRGFGIAWRAGAKIPLSRLEGMFSEFTQLELVVVSVIAGHDLAATARDDPKGRGGIFGGLGGLRMLSGLRRSPSPALVEADMVLRQRGKPASLGLVALWNAWTAVRYRELISAATFDLLVQPWVTVVGRLP